MNHEIHEKHEKVLFRDEVFEINAAVFDVCRAMGGGFLEAVYQECLSLEFASRGIPFEAMRPLKLNYKGHALKQTYVPDFVCFGQIIVELKAVRELAPDHRAQLINYLRATQLRLGLLVNFTPGGLATSERIIL
jgi:GxxExxY protein